MLIVCPVCNSELEDQGSSLKCYKCLASYPIKDGLPILLPPEAQDN